MEKKELFETLKEGLMTQFEELGKEIGIDENSADVARARITTVETIVVLDQLIEESKCGPNAIWGSCEAIKFNLANFSTNELVKELNKREGTLVLEKN